MLSATDSIPTGCKNPENRPREREEANHDGRKIIKLPSGKQAVSKADTEFKPVLYPGYFREFYCSYKKIIEAIETWGKVQSILMAHSGLNHTFIVRFNKPIQFTGKWKGIWAYLSAGGIEYTPFILSKIYKPRSYCFLSETMIAFDICCLRRGSFSGAHLLCSHDMIPDERIEKIVKKTRGLFWQEKADKVDAAFSESKKAQKLLEWIQRSGEAILERGLYKCKFENDECVEYPVDDIISKYVNRKNPWTVIMKASNHD